MMYNDFWWDEFLDGAKQNPESMDLLIREIYD